jgi:hypothetical protein
MEELLELREHLQEHRYEDALDLVMEMEEMSREDKINKIYSYAVILLLHLIKQAAEQRTTRSWDLSIRESARQIARTNKRHKTGGFYLGSDELRRLFEEAYQSALERATLEAFEGIYNENELAQKVNQGHVLTKAAEIVADLQSGAKA